MALSTELQHPRMRTHHKVPPEDVNEEALLCVSAGQMPQRQNCPFEHVKADQSRGRTPPKSPKGGRGGSAGSEKRGKGKDKSKTPCFFYPKDTCRNGKNCPFLRKGASPSVPAKGDKDGKQRAPSPAKRRPSKKRGKSADKKAACCLSSNATLTGEPSAAVPTKFALAPARAKPVPGIIGSLTRTRAHVRIHQKFRTSLYVPAGQPLSGSIWRLKGSAHARMYTSEDSKFFVGSAYNFKSGDLSKPVERWIRTTAIYLEPLPDLR